MPQLPCEYRTPRLLLRPFAATDVDAVFAYASEHHYTEYLNLPRPYERRHAEEQVAICLKELREDWAKYPSYAIVVGGEVVGTASIGVDPANWANLGYGLRHDHWGKGLVVEACRPLIADAFNVLGVARVEISTCVPNHNSRRVAEKLGFTYEGKLRQRMVVRDQRYDCAYYGLLSHEWKG